MKAFLLAAGVGSRISREVSKPKSLLDIGNGTPLIRHTVSLLQQYDIEVSIIVGYNKALFYEALEGMNVTFYDNPFYRVSNSIASLWFAKDALISDDDYLFANADVFFEKDILEKLLHAKEDITMLADYRKIEEGDYFFHCENGLVTKYGKDLDVSERTCEYVGIAKVGKRYINHFREVMIAMVDQEDYKTWWETVLYSHCEEFPIHTLDVAPYFWSEIDYIEDYERIVAYVKANKSY
ncbi:NTP transferase domain-containing protein [Candidatus Galacturonibacter soehngenii]|uniref:Phosphocholine cytidylyltransferase family protein n=1 Tax=Candidatus Galacturonatibacter soehngenii TaxID=2307010 RepID=A0A7V7QKG8_9FIRM|nr:phosphocholine cytidylyltransferase family protein [Candidatus Galacturonibacter soehngenii]KAB1438278.1 phosphocholine cytidylyltransferase family protein [Candidatus Galacturonibacter soehngenii]